MKSSSIYTNNSVQSTDFIFTSVHVTCKYLSNLYNNYALLENRYLSFLRGRCSERREKATLRITYFSSI